MWVACRWKKRVGLVAIRVTREEVKVTENQSREEKKKEQRR
jgi:hypothetical protein